jgi:hypothetical protein
VPIGAALSRRALSERKLARDRGDSQRESTARPGLAGVAACGHTREASTASKAMLGQRQKARPMGDRGQGAYPSKNLFSKLHWTCPVNPPDSIKSHRLLEAGTRLVRPMADFRRVIPASREPHQICPVLVSN